MKNLLTLLLVACFTGSFFLLSAQDSENSPIYNIEENQIINNTDTIPGFETKANKLKITGTIFQSDGITPAKDVLLFIYQADENGDYQVETKDNKRSVEHKSWIKTDEDGKYTFYTFVPGSAIEPITFPRRRTAKEIVPIIKAEGNTEYNLNPFLFDNDPLLTKSCRKRLKRKGIDSILKLEKNEDMYVTVKNIVLK